MEERGSDDPNKAMMPISELVPMRRTIILSGRAFYVWPGRIRDIAEIQLWLDTEWGDPIDELLESGALFRARGSKERSDMVRPMVAKTRIGPPRWNSAKGRELILSREGIIFFVSICLRREHPNLTIKDIVEICSGMNAKELVRLKRIFFGSRRDTEISHMLSDDDEDGMSSGQDGLAKTIDLISKERGMTYECIYNLTLNEVENIVTEGGKRSAENGSSFHGRKMSQEEYDDIVMRIMGSTPKELWGDQPSDN